MRYTHLKKCHKSVECDITINHSCHGFIHRLGHCNTSHLHNGLNRPPQLKITMPEGGDTHSMKHTHTHTNLQIFFCYISIKKFRVGKSLFLHPPPPPPSEMYGEISTALIASWIFVCIGCPGFLTRMLQASFRAWKQFSPAKKWSPASEEAGPRLPFHLKEEGKKKTRLEKPGQRGEIPRALVVQTQFESVVDLPPLTRPIHAIIVQLMCNMRPRTYNPIKTCF